MNTRARFFFFSTARKAVVVTFKIEVYGVGITTNLKCSQVNFVKCRYVWRS